jgi:DNA-directed RNA polymerase II subunit RPB1
VKSFRPTANAYRILAFSSLSKRPRSDSSTNIEKMANLYFAHSSAPLKTVEEIQFGLLGPEEIKNMSVINCIYPETMDETRTKPRDGGLNDPLLGSVDRQFKCKTCTENASECVGHFGHIELAKPVFHPGFIKKVKKVLEIVCHNCSKVLADRVSIELHRAQAYL